MESKGAVARSSGSAETEELLHKEFAARAGVAKATLMRD
jgi:hypothetical protein